jgi:CheY-like chemotaxis protein
MCRTSCAAAAALPTPVTIAESGSQAITLLSQQPAGTFQLVLTVRCVSMCLRTCNGCNCAHECKLTSSFAYLLFRLQDVMMPQVDGLELLRHVRLHHPGLPVVSECACMWARVWIHGKRLEYCVQQ